MLISPLGKEIAYALQFKFKATNKEAKYEAVVAGLQLCVEMGAKEVKVLSDSQLVVGQSNGDAEAKNEQMKRYSTLVAKIQAPFQKVIFL